MSDYLLAIQARLLEHRYRYYVLNDNVLNDFEYDWLERYYINLCKEEGVISILDDAGIGWVPSRKEYMEAAHRVDTKQDQHSLWEAEMQATWDRLGKPKERPQSNENTE